MAELKIATGKTLPAPPDAKKVRAFKIYRWNRMMAKPQSSARQPRCFLMLHPLEQVGDHQNPLAHTPALTAGQAPQLRRPRFAAKEIGRHRLSQKWYAWPTTLPHLEASDAVLLRTPT